jgi:hypothetical protein
MSVTPSTAMSNISVLNVGKLLTITVKLLMMLIYVKRVRAIQASRIRLFQVILVILSSLKSKYVIINGVILSSGLKVYAGRDVKNWRVVGNEITLIYKNIYHKEKIIRRIYNKFVSIVIFSIFGCYFIYMQH